MKRKDLVVVIIAAFLSGALALVVSTLLISTPKNRRQKAEVVQPIVADFPEPNKKYFNDKSIDPTQLIRIGENTNPSPFNGN
jgi:hypothetical protein